MICCYASRKALLTALVFIAVQFTPFVKTQFAPIESLASARQESTPPSHTIPLKGGLLHASGFFFDAKVGGQPLTLQVDTTYSSLIVPRSGCVGCRVGDRRYDPKKSTAAATIACDDHRCSSEVDQCKSKMCFSCSSKGNCCVPKTNTCAFNVFYGDGSSGNGTLLSDNVEIGDMKAQVLLGAMHEESHNFELPYADGVFGFAFQKGACHPACIPPVMDTVVNQTGIKNVVTMCVTRYGGTLVLGAADASLATHPYQYVDMEEVADDNRFIVPALSEWKIGDRPLSVPAITTAVLSAGTTDIAVSKSTFLAFLDLLTQHYCHIPGLCSMTSWFRPQRCTTIPDDAVKAMPNITIGLTKGVSLTLGPDDYLIKYRVIKDKQYRCVAFIATDGLADKGIGLLLGTAIMKPYAVVYDRQQKRVGVAPAREGKCGPLTGSDDGLPGSAIGKKGDGSILTADTPKADLKGADGGSPIQTEIAEAEKCRAESTCSGCSQMLNCSFGYQTGRCVPVHEATRTPYPYCVGSLCMCFAVGPSGWYVGIAVGALVAIGIVGVGVLIYRKRRRNQYQMVQQYEEQDLETF